MSKIGSYTLTATTTSADVTAFAYNQGLPQGCRGMLVYWRQTAPAVSAATCCAEVALCDSAGNLLWHSGDTTSGSSQAEATTLASGAGHDGNAYQIPIEDTDLFYVQWSARPSGASTGPPGANCTSTLKIWLKES